MNQLAINRYQVAKMEYVSGSNVAAASTCNMKSATYLSHATCYISTDSEGEL